MSNIFQTHEQIPEGTRLGDRYEVGKLIGSGGFAEVYDAFDGLIERSVAVKILCIDVDDAQERETILERFKIEAQAAAQIDHLNVVTIFDMGVYQKENLPYIVMERLEGHDIEEELRLNGKMQTRRALRLVSRCLEGLQVAHKLGIIHKDLKPSNLFITHPGTDREDIRILDFGIARHTTKGGALTGEGRIMGTPQYMAPEYIREHKVSPALDVYQMGLILCEMLTGEQVVDDNDMMRCIMIHGNEGLQIDSMLMRSPIGPIIASALEPDPAVRYRDAASLKAVLDEVDPLTVMVGGERKPLKETGWIRRASTQAADVGEEALDLEGFALGAEGSHTTAPRDIVAGTSPTVEHVVFERGTSPVKHTPPPELRSERFELEPERFERAPERFERAPERFEPEPARVERAPAPSSGASIEPAPPARRRMEPIQIPETPSHQKRPPSARGPGKKRWGLAIGLASAALIVGLMIVVGLQNDDADGPTEALPQSPTQSVTRARPERKAELSATISVGIISEPNGATVSDGEEILGQAPMTVHLKRSKPARKLTFKLEGHRSRTLVIRGRDSPMRVIKLRK